MIYRLLLKSQDHMTVDVNDANNFQSITFPLNEIPMDVMSEMLQSKSLNFKVEWYKIYNYNNTPFAIALKNIHQTNTFSSTKKLSTNIILYGQEAYKMLDYKSTAGITTVDYHFIRNRELTVTFVDAETEQVLANNDFGSTDTDYILSLLITY